MIGWIMQKLERERRRRIEKVIYQRSYHDMYDYSLLKCIPVKRTTGAGSHRTYADCVVTFDTETSRRDPDVTEPQENYVVAWSITIMSYDHLLVTLWGTDPESAVAAINKIKATTRAEMVFIYVHNLNYDWHFMRKFFIREWTEPSRQLNVKAHQPIRIEFPNGIIFRDSLILAQRSLERWANDLDVEHKKAVGKWDYDRVRDQGEMLTDDELLYLCNDTISQAECINVTRRTLGKNISSMPYTATGIPREECRNRGKQHRAHDRFVRMDGGYKVYNLLEKCFHGGYTHANRHKLNRTIRGDIACYDFSSSYSYVVLSEKFCVEKFTPVPGDVTVKDILTMSHTYGFIFYACFIDVILKNDDIPMPYMQLSKCERTVDYVADNGRILWAKLAIIPLTEIDLEIIEAQYNYEECRIFDCHFAYKDYLPKWFTDTIWEYYKGKCELKSKDRVLYNLSKAKLNASSFGMLAQHCIRDEIHEDYKTGEFYTEKIDDRVKEYDKYVNRITSFLPYQWGVYVTAYAARNLYRLGSCLNPENWLYSDTDSIYGIGFDVDKIDEYNRNCIEKLKSRGYEQIEVDGRVFTPGVAELDGTYTEFRTCGAKRYAKRDTDGKLSITVAGVPKSGFQCLKDNIDNFAPGLIFDGETTGKLMHTYFNVDEIYTDERGNVCGDSISLTKCDYLLDSEEERSLDELIFDWIEVQTYE